MIASVEGVLELQSPGSIVVRVGGIGLRLQVPTTLQGRIGSVGDVVRLSTHLHVREDNLALFGFGSDEELRMFELLLTVSGVGPRLALTLLSATSVEMLSQALASGKPEALTGVPGVGKKLAGRLVLELKGKVEAPVALAAAVPGSALDGDVLAALTGLGYSVAEAQSAIRSLPDDAELTTEERIVRALRYFARQ